jgi:hypothetical protein
MRLSLILSIISAVIGFSLVNTRPRYGREIPSNFASLPFWLLLAYRSHGHCSEAAHCLTSRSSLNVVPLIHAVFGTGVVNLSAGETPKKHGGPLPKRWKGRSARIAVPLPQVNFAVTPALTFGLERLGSAAYGNSSIAGSAS